MTLSRQIQDADDHTTASSYDLILKLLEKASHRDAVIAKGAKV